MLTVNTQFESELKKIIDADIERLKDLLADGSGVPDYPTYRRYVGEIMALRRVAEAYFDEVNQKINERMRDG